MLALLAVIGGVASAWQGGVLQVDYWTSRDGLPQNTVTDVLQSADGYIWVTTFGGVARFDGVRFEVLSPATVPEIPTSRFVSLAQTADGGLWLGTETEGLVRWDGATFTRVGPESPGVVWDLAVDRDDAVWAATGRGLYRLHEGVVERVDPRPTDAVRIRADGTVWGASELGAYCVGGCGPELVGPVQLGEGPDGTLYAVDEAGGQRLEAGAWVPFALDHGGEASRLVSWRGGLWTLSGRSLLSVDHPGERVAISHRVSGQVRALLVDREDGLWVGLTGGGLARVRSTGVDRLSSFSDRVGVGSAGQIVAWGCPGVEVVAGEPGGVEGLPPFCGSGAWDAAGGLWLLGRPDDRDGGLYRWDDRRLERSGWQPVSDGTLIDGPWLSDAAGVVQLHPDGPVRVVSSADLGVEGLTVVRSDEEAVWALGSDRRLRRIGSGGVDRVLPALPGKATVRDVLPGIGGVWVSTYGGGLFWLETGGRTVEVSMADGLCDDWVSRLVSTDDGFLWMNTNRGAGRIRWAELSEVVQGKRSTVTCELLDSGEANGGSGVLVDGRQLYLPTIHGVVHIDTATAIGDPIPPLVRLETAAWGAEPVEDGAVLYGADDLRARFTGLAFDDPVGLRFRHRLLGHDETWSPLGTDRLLHYVDLPPGPYRLEVQARSARGAWSDVASLAFERHPLWWETRLSQQGIPLLSIGAVLALLLVRVRRTTRQNAELRHEVEQRHRAEALLREQQAENERALRELESARRLESLGRLAGGVAHDFNNLLTVILGRIEPLRRHADGEVAEAANVVGTATDRAAGLTAQLLAFGRRSDQRAEVLDVSQSLRDLRDVLHGLVGEGTRLSMELADGLYVRMERSRLEQTVANLCVNARDAVGPGGHVSIAVRPDGAHVVIEVCDDGEGIAPDVAAHVFEPYFTTKPAGRGLGLGLATVHGLVREVGGTIGFDSEPGVGTTFRVVLPRVTDEAPKRRKVSIPPVLGGLRVLLVDDDDDVRETVSLQLQLRGAEVTATGSPDEAVGLAGSEAIDVLVTDVLMPAMSGSEVARRVREVRDVPVLYISGHTGDALGFERGVTVLRKPFSSEALARAVLEVSRERATSG
ncbi:MAG: response regulator [Alphaproteobacteria bacterium]|nr:response regulator [Alphaproteobacteria bacterium]